MKTVFIVSDSTGDTAERLVRAATLQFSENCAVRLFSRVRTEAEYEQLVEQAAEQRALVVFTIVNADARELFLRLIERYSIESVDLMGALIGKLALYLGASPAGVPGLLHSITDDYFRRIEAVEFAVKNDDGAEPRNLPKADLVLVGISRTSKTPLSTYLAHRGLKVANVPLVLGVPPPVELASVDERRIFGLVIGPDSLMKIRQNRLSHLGMPGDASYGQRAHIEEEMRYARDIFRSHPNWPIIDVTNRAVEETAADILRIYEQRARDAASAAGTSAS